MDQRELQIKDPETEFTYSLVLSNKDYERALVGK